MDKAVDNDVVYNYRNVMPDINIVTEPSYPEKSLEPDVWRQYLDPSLSMLLVHSALQYSQEKKAGLLIIRESL